jgi:hypothetical protein
MAHTLTNSFISRAGYARRGLAALAVAIGGVVLGSAGYAHHSDFFATLGTLAAGIGAGASNFMFARAVRAGRRRTPLLRIRRALVHNRRR